MIWVPFVLHREAASDMIWVAFVLHREAASGVIWVAFARLLCVGRGKGEADRSIQ